MVFAVGLVTLTLLGEVALDRSDGDRERLTHDTRLSSATAALRADVLGLDNKRLQALAASPFDAPTLRDGARDLLERVKSQVRALPGVGADKEDVATLSRAVERYAPLLDAQFEASDNGEATRAFQLSATTSSGAAAEMISAAEDLAQTNRTGARDRARAPLLPLVALSFLSVLLVLASRQRSHLARAARADSDDGQRRARLADALFDGLTVVDRTGHIVHANQSLRRFIVGAGGATGIEESGETPVRGGTSVVGRTVADLLPAEQADRIERFHEQVLRTGRAATVTVTLPPGGETTQVEITMSRPIDPEWDGLVWTWHDATERHELEKELLFKAFHDPLTGLPNRALFRERAAEALRRADPDTVTSVLFIDLDGFKTINDSLGHEAGDELIIEMANRLGEVIRGSDTLARFGGDEFAVLVEDVRTRFADLLAARLLNAIKQPLKIRGKDVSVTGSIGLAEAGPEATVEVMLRNADSAMYAAKAKGRNRVERFHNLMFQEAMDRLELENQLRRAAELGQLRLNYQPIVELATGRLVGVEALVRWFHPERGVIAPSLFISLAEESDVIVDLGRWVMQHAVAEAARLHEKLPLSMSVNVSARQLVDDELPKTLAKELERHNLDPSFLTLEITESNLLEDAVAFIDRVKRLKELGVRIAIDDFGTGYSSLSYLHRLPVDTVKIDRSFISGSRLTGPGGDSFVEAIIRLAQTLGLTTLAEGIEEEAQLEWLRDAGCVLGQGYYFGKPMSTESLHQAIEEAAREARVPAPVM